jgi:hypothetical protein
VRLPLHDASELDMLQLLPKPSVMKTAAAHLYTGPVIGLVAEGLLNGPEHEVVVRLVLHAFSHHCTFDQRHVNIGPSEPLQ